jgi:CBS domain-containing protein
VHCTADTPLATAFKQLGERGFLSMPVVTTGVNACFCGWLDMADIASFIAFKFSNHTWASAEDFATFYEQSKCWYDATVRDAIGKLTNFRVPPSYAISGDCSLFQVFEMMARSDVPRVAVLTPERQVATVITQSMMVRHVHANMALLSSELRHMPVSAMLLHHDEPVCVRTTDTAMLAFQIMSEKGVTGLGVVDAHGALVDVISVRDLRALTIDAASFYRLYLTVGELKDALRASTPDTPRGMIIAQPTTTYEEIVNLLVANKVHRVFIVDTQGKPTKCVCLSDVLLQLLTSVAA